MRDRSALLPLILILASLLLLPVDLLARSEGDGLLSLGMASNLLLIAAMVLQLIGNRRRKG